MSIGKSGRLEYLETRTGKRPLKRPVRSQRGENLVGLLVAVSLMSLVAAGVLSLALVSFTHTTKAFNRSDALNATRSAMERIGRDVRTARSVGDLYGNVLPPTQQLVDTDQLGTGPSTDTTAVHWQDEVPIDQLLDGTAMLGSASFPSAGDPFYGQGQVPGAGWPLSPWPALPYVLSPTTLIVQLPCFDANGLPVEIEGAGANIEAMDTYVYQVLPDPNDQGKFMLQVAGFAGGSSSNMQITSQPQTILTGIVGPKDPVNPTTVKIFQFLSKLNPTPLSTVAPSQVSSISGISVNLEVERQDSGQTSTLALRQDFFMRNNTLATQIGPATGSEE